MQNHDIRVLNDLIETTIDSAEGYAEAARETQSPRFSVTFRERASERRLVATRERGEDHIKHKFEDALEDGDVSPPIRALIAETFRSVRSGHDQMRGLKRATHRTH